MTVRLLVNDSDGPVSLAVKQTASCKLTRHCLLGFLSFGEGGGRGRKEPNFLRDTTSRPTPSASLEQLPFACAPASLPVFLSFVSLLSTRFYPTLALHCVPFTHTNAGRELCFSSVWHWNILLTKQPLGCFAVVVIRAFSPSPLFSSPFISFSLCLLLLTLTVRHLCCISFSFTYSQSDYIQQHAKRYIYTLYSSLMFLDL